MLVCIACLFSATLASASTPAVVQEKLIGDPSFRHSGTIIDAVALPDGKRVLTSGIDGSVRMWDLESGKELRRYVHSHHSYVWDISLMPGSEKFITANSNGEIMEWDIASSATNLLTKMKGHVFRTTLSPDGSTLAIGASDEFVLWDLKNKKRSATFRRGKNRDANAYCGVFLNSGKHLMAGFAEAGAIFVRLADTNVIQELPNACQGVYSLTVSPDEKAVLACTDKMGLLCIDAATFATKWEALDGFSKVYSAAWSPDQSRIAVCCDAGGRMEDTYRLHILDAKKGETVLSKLVHTEGSHYCVAFTVDGKQILCGSGNVLTRFDAQTGERIFPKDNGKVFLNTSRSFVAAPPAMTNMLATGSGKGLVKIDPKTGLETGTWHTEIDFDELSMSPDGRFIAGSDDSRVFVIDASTDKAIAIIDTDGSVRDMTLSGGGKGLLVRTYQQSEFYRLPSGKYAGTLEALEDLSVDRYASQIKGPLLACASDAMITVYDTRRMASVASMSVADNVNDMAFFPAGGASIIASAGNKLYLWSPDSGKDKASDKKIARALRDLGAKKFSARENATQFLISQGSSALNALKQANTADPEVRERVARIRSSIIADKVYGETTHVLESEAGKIKRFAVHPTKPYWLAITDHPSDTYILVGDVKDGKIRILSKTYDPNGPRALTFGKDGAIYTSNSNGTIGIYRFTED